MGENKYVSLDQVVKEWMANSESKLIVEGSSVRLELVRIVTNTSREYSDVDEIISEANKLLAWINRELYQQQKQ